jgi:hypothetical protein
MLFHKIPRVVAAIPTPSPIWCDPLHRLVVHLQIKYSLPLLLSKLHSWWSVPREDRSRSDSTMASKV